MLRVGAAAVSRIGLLPSGSGCCHRRPRRDVGVPVVQFERSSRARVSPATWQAGADLCPWPDLRAERACGPTPLQLACTMGTTMKKKTCATCRRRFVPSSRHLSCPTCRSQSVCGCGRPKQAKSQTCADCRSERGESNGNWKGGTTRHKAGYVMVRRREHPRSGKSGYVFEHIVVAEAMLGPHLVLGESVHHRNGVKHDNRPENLELWTRPQPSGIRASDAIEWAHTILDRYGDGDGHPPPTVLTANSEHSWRWRESNPRPPASQ